MKLTKKIVSVILACLLCISVGTTAALAANYIGDAKAKEIAFEKAGITAEQAKFVICKLDYDNGIAVYDVEFYFDKAEYDCEINAKTGAVLKFKKEVSGVNVPDPTTEYIGKVKAKEIALANAGVKEADARKLRVEFEYDDGVAKYDVDFHFNKYDYDYEIDALTGNILKAEKDREISFSDIFFVRWIESFIAALRNLFTK